jgi:hypothetical protein
VWVGRGRSVKIIFLNRQKKFKGGSF